MFPLLLSLSLGQIDIRSDGGYVGRARNIIDCRGGLACSVDAGVGYISGASVGGGVTDAKYIVGEAHSGLSAEVAPSAADQVPVSDSTTAATWRSVPDCDDSAGQHLNYDTATNAFSCGSTGNATTSVLEFTNQTSMPVQDGGTNTLMFSRAIGPCGVPTYLDVRGTPTIMAGGLGPNRWVGGLSALSGGTALTVGVDAYTTIGSGGTHTATAFSIGGNWHTTQSYGNHRTTAGANNSMVGIKSGTLSPFFRGMDDGGTYVSGGFLVTMRVGSGTADADQRVFWGLYGATTDHTSTNDPDAAPNTIYVGANAADTNLSICSNDATGTATCSTLGASFPAKAFGVYDIWFCAPPASSSVGYYIRRLDTKVHTEASGSISSDLPAANITLYRHAYMGNGPTGTPSTATQIDSHFWGLNLQ